MPVYASNEDYRAPTGPASPADKAEFLRVCSLFVPLGGGGGVFAGLISPDAVPISTFAPADVFTSSKVLATLQKVADKYAVKPGEPLVKPRPLSTTPNAPPGSLIAHLTARAPEGIEANFPAEQWFVFTTADMAKMTPRVAEPGASWDMDPEIAQRILRYIYPRTTESFQADLNQILSYTFKGRIISVQNGVVQARLDANLVMRRPQRNLPDSTVKAQVIGYMIYSPGKPAIQELGLFTWKALWDTSRFEAGLLSLPEKSQAANVTKEREQLR